MSKLTFNRIKELLAKKGKQSTELAAYVEKTTRTVSTWCTNKNQPPVEILFKIARFLDVEAGELLTLRKDLIDVVTKNTARTAATAKAAPKKEKKKIKN